MRWAAIFTDKPDTAALRAEHTDAHIAYLGRNKGKIILCGALRPAPDEAPKGGLWLFEADTKAEVEAIIAEDPFFINGLRASSDIYAWLPAPDYVDVVIAPKG